MVNTSWRALFWKSLEKYEKKGCFSGWLRLDWGSDVRAAKAGLGSIGLKGDLPLAVFVPVTGYL